MALLKYCWDALFAVCGRIMKMLVIDVTKRIFWEACIINYKNICIICFKNYDFIVFIDIYIIILVSLNYGWQLINK